MNGRRSEERAELSLSIIEDLKGKGFNQSDIAELFGVTRQAVSDQVRKYGRPTKRQAALEQFPFDVPAEMQWMAPCRNLRNAMVHRAGVKLPEDSLKRLRSFIKKLREEDLVVEFDPAIPPIPGVSSKGGWAFRRRVSGDGNLLIRVNEFTRLTKEGNDLLQLPSKDP